MLRMHGLCIQIVCWRNKAKRIESKQTKTNKSAFDSIAIAKRLLQIPIRLKRNFYTLDFEFSLHSICNKMPDKYFTKKIIRVDSGEWKMYGVDWLKQQSHSILVRTEKLI